MRVERIADGYAEWPSWNMGRPPFAWGRMQNVAIVAVLSVSAVFQMWFSCGERRRSPNVRGLLLTFCGQGAKVCAAFILRKTAWPFCDGCAYGRPGHVFPRRAGSRFCTAKSPLYIYQGQARILLCVGPVGISTALCVVLRLG